MVSHRLPAVIALTVVALGAAPPPQMAQPPARSIVVLGDLHMGSGRDSRGQWLPDEDFRWSAEFAAFLKAVSRDGNNAVDLVLNGDTFELIDSVRCGTASDAGCSEDEATARLDQVLKAHAAELNALSEFARTGSNRVVLVAGDQDAALLFEGVQKRFYAATAAPRDRMTIAPVGYWLSADGQVYAEHGHQIGFSAHRLDQWPSPFVKRSGPSRLSRSGGERLLAELGATYEPRFPIIDNLAGLGTGFRYAVALEPKVSDRLLTQLVRHHLLTMSWSQFRVELDDGDVLPPTWDLAQVRAQGLNFITASIPDDDPLDALVTKAVTGGGLNPIELSDDELIAVCDYRAAMRRARRRFEPTLTQLAPRGPAVSECPRMPDSRGSTFEYFWRSRDLMFSRHLDAVGRRVSSSARPIRVFVHGHTHLPDRAQTTANMISGGLLKVPMEGFSPRRGELTPIVINGGAWQRTMTPVQLELLAAGSGRPILGVMTSTKPEDLSPCFSFVHVTMKASEPIPAVRYWRETAPGQWSVGVTCGR
jgi:UDP-2,3-diacylglucosamine pyrophosphatase LpxH